MKLLLRNQWKKRVTLRRNYHELSFAQHGDPLQVLHYHHQQQYQPQHYSENTITIQLKYAAWNPADTNLIQGKYPALASPGVRKSPFTQRTVAGAEAIGRVVDMPDSVNHIKRGDLVIPIGGIGTLRSHVALPPECVLPVFSTQQHDMVPHDAIFFQLAGTAYNLLQQQSPNCKAIVQNAGNAAVSTVLSQMAYRLSIPVVSFVRRQSQIDLLQDYLTSTCHATHVLLQEDYLHDRTQIRRLRDEYPFQLALNAVGGLSSNLLLQLLQPSSKHVTYGGMSREPVTVSTSDLLFRNVQLSGYWHSQWMWQQPTQRLDFVQQLVRDYYLQIQLPPVQVFALSDWSEALRWNNEQTGPIRSKVVFDLSQE